MEDNVLERLKFLLDPPPKHVVDVGAHDGTWSLKLSGALPDDTTFTLVECNEDMQEPINKVRQVMGVDRTAQIHAMAKDRECEFDYHVNMYFPSGGSGYKELTDFYSEGLYETRKLRGFTLDYMLRSRIQQKACPVPDFLKIDVQGGELDVIRGAPLSLTTINAIYMEVSVLPYNQEGPLFHEVINTMQALGWYLVDIETSMKVENYTVQFDCFFVRKGSLYWNRALENIKKVPANMMQIMQNHQQKPVDSKKKFSPNLQPHPEDDSNSCANSYASEDSEGNDMPLDDGGENGPASPTGAPSPDLPQQQQPSPDLSQQQPQQPSSDLPQQQQPSPDLSQQQQQPSPDLPDGSFSRASLAALGQVTHKSNRRPRVLFVDPFNVPYTGKTPRTKPLGGTQSALCYLCEEIAVGGQMDAAIVNHCGGGDGPTVVNGVEYFDLGDGCTPQGLAKIVNSYNPTCLVVVNFLALGPILHKYIEESVVLPDIHLVHFWSLTCGQMPNKPPINEQIEQANCFHSHSFLTDWHAAKCAQELGPNIIRSHIITRNAPSPMVWETHALNRKVQKISRKNPITVAYTSTPFRGLDALLKIWPDVHKKEPMSKLRIYSSMKVYGWAEKQDNEEFGHLYEKAKNMPGVEYVGSVNQGALARVLKKTDVWAYPCVYEEVSCISAMEAMASGCRIVCMDNGALPETTTHGAPEHVHVAPDMKLFESQLAECIASVRKSGQANHGRKFRPSHKVPKWADVAKKFVGDMGGGFTDFYLNGLLHEYQRGFQQKKVAMFSSPPMLEQLSMFPPNHFDSRLCHALLSEDSTQELRVLLGDLGSGAVDRPSLVHPTLTGSLEMLQNTGATVDEWRRHGDLLRDVLVGAYPVLNQNHPRGASLVQEINQWRLDATNSRKIRVGFIANGFWSHTSAKLVLGLIDLLYKQGGVEIILIEPQDSKRDTLTKAFESRCHKFVRFPYVGRSMEQCMDDIWALDLHCAIFASVGDNDIIQHLCMGSVAGVQFQHLWGLPFYSGSDNTVTISMEPMLQTEQKQANTVYFQTLSTVFPAVDPYDPSGLGRYGVAPKQAVKDAIMATPKSTGYQQFEEIMRGYGNNYSIYTCVQSDGKYSPQFCKMCRGLLEKDPNGILITVGVSQDRINLIDSSEATKGRVFNLPHMQHHEILFLMQRVPVSLDTFPWCGGLTTLESLSLGLPVVCMEGDRMLYNLSSAIYGVADRGLQGQMACKDVEGYIDTAIKVVSDKGKHKQVLEKKAKKLFESQDAVFESWLGAFKTCGCLKE
jgi:FkbM family methyltransferase